MSSFRLGLRHGGAGATKAATAWRHGRVLAVLCAALLLGACAGALNLPGGQRPRAYTVHPGDTLYSIAWHYGLDYHAVARWNAIPPPYTIYPGQHIRLYPAGAQRGGKSAQTAANNSEAPAPGPSSASAPGNAAAPVAWQWPARGRLDPTFGQHGLSGKGIVIEGKLGQPVMAAAAGTVVYSGSALVGYGRLVIVKHNDEWLSAYAHNQRLLVHEGERVEAGEEIATMGVGPGNKPGLYFEIRHDGSPVNPLRFLPKQS